MLRLVLMLLVLCNSLALFAQSNRLREAEAYYHSAYQHYIDGEYARARSEIDHSINLNDTPSSRFLSGLLFENEGRPLRAVSSFEAATQLDPEYTEAIFKKALIYLRHGDPQQATDDFSYLINHFNRFHETKSIIFQIDETGEKQNKIMTTNMMEADLFHYRAQAYQKMGADEQALEDLNQAIGIEQEPEYFVTRGLFFAGKQKDNLARQDFTHAIQLDSTYHLAWYNLALIDPGLDIPLNVLTDHQFAPTLNLLSSRAMEAGNNLQAKQYLDKAVDVSQRDPLVFLNRGRLLNRLTQYEEARADFLQALEIDPRRVEALYLIGNTYYFQKKYTQALAYYNQYLAIESDNGMIWYNGAMCYLEQKNDMEACHYLEMADQLGMTQAKTLLASHCKSD